MISLFHARRSAEELAALIDGESRSTVTAEAATLLQVVDTLRSQAPVTPREDFARDLRAQLLLEAEERHAPVHAALTLPARQRGPRERRLVAAASAFVLVGGTATMAAAAQGALPGEPLYPLKRGIERAEVALSLNEAGKGGDLLGQASGRLAEVEGLLDSEGTQAGPRVADTLATFAATADEGAALMFEAYRQSGDSEPVEDVRRFAADAIDALENLADSVPAGAHADLAAAATVLRDIDAAATELCASCAAGLPAVEVPSILLVHGEADRALTLAARSDLGNDHPVTVPKAATRRAPAVAPVLPPTLPPVPAAQAGPSTPLPGAPVRTPLEPSWPSLLPGVDGGAPAPDGNASADDGVVGGLLGGLSGAVETLLPEPDADLLD